MAANNKKKRTIDMIIYNNFSRESYQPQAVRLAPPPLKSMGVATNWELGRIWYFRRLAIATCALNLSRREIPNWMADVIFGYDGAILNPDGTKFIISDTAIDDAFNNDESFRWLSAFLKFAELLPPKQKPQCRIYDRLRLIELALQIAYPGRLNRQPDILN
jgi:hypothetical protein